MRTDLIKLIKDQMEVKETETKVTATANQPIDTASAKSTRCVTS
jgi:hypothetical protein